MRFIFSLIIIIISFFSCKKEKQNIFVSSKSHTIDAVIEELDYSDKISHVKAFTKKGNYNKDIAFMIDYSVHSGKKRFFVVDLKNDSIIKKELVCHGDGKGKNTTGIPTVFSNKSETHCSSLGMAVMGERAYSRWGKNYKYWIDGLEKTNSNMRKRVVVLHGWKGMPEIETYPNPIATSWGCPTVSVNVLDELDELLKENKKVLLYSFE